MNESDTQVAEQATEVTPAVDSPELAAYKLRVRDEALRVKQTNGWCEEGVNETLRNLGLDELPKPKQFTFAAPTTGEIQFTVTAYTLEDAERMVTSHYESDKYRMETGTRGYRSPNYGSVRNVKIGELNVVGAPTPTDTES